jgi:hypothetical protein
MLKPKVPPSDQETERIIRKYLRTGRGGKKARIALSWELFELRRPCPVYIRRELAVLFASMPGRVEIKPSVPGKEFYTRAADIALFITDRVSDDGRLTKQIVDDAIREYGVTRATVRRIWAEHRQVGLVLKELRREEKL